MRPWKVSRSRRTAWNPRCARSSKDREPLRAGEKQFLDLVVEIFGTEGVGYDFHEAFFYEIDAHVFIARRGKGDSRHRWLQLADLGERRDAIHLRHFEIDEHEV